MRRTGRLAVVAIVGAVLVAGCSDDGGDEASGEEAADATEDAVRACEPVGTDLEDQATTVVDVGLEDYAIVLPGEAVEAGVVTFRAENTGTEEHELAVLPGGGEVPLTEEGLPDEEALEAAGAFELEAFGPDQSCSATWELAAGDYTLFCVVRSPDGETHLAQGMQADLVVR